MMVNLKDDVITVTRATDTREDKALHGLTRTLINNMVVGVSQGYQKQLDIVGVGYRVEAAGQKLVLRVGYSHPVEVAPAAGITLKSEGTNKLFVSGIDKEAVGQQAAEIRGIRPPDSYKGKGIRYSGEKVRLKAGKAGKAIGKKK